MAEIAKIKKVEKAEDKPRRERRHRDMSIGEIMPEPFTRALKSVWMLVLIPLSLVVGLVDGICHGFVKGLETALEIYRKEQEK